MAAPFPYTNYACPCSDLTSTAIPLASKRTSTQPFTTQTEEDRTFNPHDPRANHALYPLEQLLYCDECDSISCPRCWTEEILYWYCPSCLFEVPSSVVRADGNRCSRSCYNCPTCTAPLAIVALPQPDDGLLRPDDGTTAGMNERYMLHCQYCEWSSLDIDVTFSKATKITEQLAKQRKSKIASRRGTELTEWAEDAVDIDHDGTFANLSKFYKEQLNETGDMSNPFSNSPYSSPANLARIMSLYGGLSYNALKKTHEKPQSMREALKLDEGLATLTLGDLHRDEALVDLLEGGWKGTSNQKQQLSAPINTDARLVSQLWPTATPLRTRRGKRCRTCRQFLARPEPKVSSMRYRIRLLAQQYLPQISIKPLQASTPASDRLFALRTDTPKPPPLKPFEAKQYILSVRNPVFETVQVTLATPTVTPGHRASRVTILCPSFAVGPAGDVWDEVLSAESQPQILDGGRRAAMASLTGSADPDRQPEAGKVWERTRNTTSVIVEIVPGSSQRALRVGACTGEGPGDVDNELTEDDLVLEVPVYVRAEWEAEAKEGESSMGKKSGERRPGEKVKKELGYWVVLGIGQIEE